MNKETDLCSTIEPIASNTWPAEASHHLEHWLVRASQGVTKRANSVLAIGEYPKDPQWLAKIEQFYLSQHLPAIFHVSGASPAGLDERLEAEGYSLDTPCLLMSASSHEVAERAYNKRIQQAHSAVTTVWTDKPDADWLAAFLELEQFPEERRAFYAGLFDRMPEAKGFVKLLQDGQILALGTALVEGEWAGFVNVVVHENHRGKGIGYLLMHALTEWSMEQGAQRQYLQVVASNQPAVSLYEKLGYQASSGYHYRVKYDL
ncbi:GNAT family N-acetyltransferase [Paenibacillus ferrarius]|uniref:GNAT family N-acetyltransferase n=1 Tax=Paenibacillus ferrarius TaxID=1469647 RepID=UPI001301B300|nr:GNAT family N-acetyltransferase [Paenibacillus ferrarius]